MQPKGTRKSGQKRSISIQILPHSGRVGPDWKMGECEQQLFVMRMTGKRVGKPFGATFVRGK